MNLSNSFLDNQMGSRVSLAKPFPTRGGSNWPHVTMAGSSSHRRRRSDASVLRSIMNGTPLTCQSPASHLMLLSDYCFEPQDSDAVFCTQVCTNDQAGQIAPADCKGTWNLTR